MPHRIRRLHRTQNALSYNRHGIAARFPRPHLAVALAGFCLFACSTTDTRARGETRQAIAALLDSMATSISNRDANAIAARMPGDSPVVYVSDGRAIRGTDLRSL